MDHRDERDGEQVLVPVRAPWPSPLLQGVVELLGVPAELTLDEQVNRRGMMPVVLQDEFLPRERKKVRKFTLALTGSPSGNHAVQPATIGSAQASSGALLFALQPNAEVLHAAIGCLDGTAIPACETKHHR